MLITMKEFSVMLVACNHVMTSRYDKPVRLQVRVLPYCCFRRDW